MYANVLRDPMDIDDDTVLLVQCKERQWALSLIFDYYNYKMVNSLKWITNSVIFTAIDIVDKYFYSYCHCMASRFDAESEKDAQDSEYFSDVEDMKLIVRPVYGKDKGSTDKLLCGFGNDVVNSSKVPQSMLLTKDRVMQIALVCCYVAMKYHLVFTELPTLEQFNIKRIPIENQEWGSLEREIAINCLEGRIHYTSVYEIARCYGVRLTAKDVSNLLMLMQSSKLPHVTYSHKILELYLFKLRYSSQFDISELHSDSWEGIVKSRKDIYGDVVHRTATQSTRKRRRGKK